MCSMKDINKFNESLKYRIDINYRNIVSAICLLEFYKLQNYATNNSDTKILNELIQFAKREMSSNIPMRLLLIKDAMPVYKIEHSVSMSSSFIYYGTTNKPLTKLLSDTAANTIFATTEPDEYFVYKYPIDLPKLESVTMDGAFNVIQAFDYSEESFTTETGVNTRLRVYTAANPGAFTNVKLSFK